MSQGLGYHVLLVGPQNPDPGVPGRRHSLWYKDAIVYELHVRTFHDSDGDGIVDFAGMQALLDCERIDCNPEQEAQSDDHSPASEPLESRQRVFHFFT